MNAEGKMGNAELWSVKLATDPHGRFLFIEGCTVCDGTERMKWERGRWKKLKVGG